MGSHGSEPAAVLVALRRIVRFLRLADREAEAANGLSAAQLYVLNVLVDAPARSLAEIAERTMTDQSSVSTVVAKLVARRFVARKTSGADRRRIELRLTEAGHRVSVASPQVPQMRIVEAVRAMTPSRRLELVRGLENLSGAIGANAVAPRMLFDDEPTSPRRRRRRRPRPGSR